MNYLLSTLGVLFIGLKLTNIINWSWWLVLLPLYPMFCILSFIFFLLIFFLLVFGYAVRDKSKIIKKFK